MRLPSGKFLAVACLLLACPALADDVADIVINELMYNPASGDAQEDFIELFNLSPTASYDLQGFHFTSGVSFTFPAVTLGPRQYLVVCANQARIRQVYGITNTVGDWDPATSLDNGGERIKLVNTAGVEVEDFTFDDRNPWPILADGFGHSLERRNPGYDNDRPANWSASQVATGWTRVTATGLATSSTLYFYLTGAGTAYLDDVKLYPVGNPGDNHVQNGGFEAGLAPWTPSGTHLGSAASTENANTGSTSLKIVATGAGSGSGQSVAQGSLGLTVGDQYTLEFQILFDTPGQTLVARLSQAAADEAELYVETGGGGASAGKENSVFTTDIPPFIYPAAHSPATPTSSSSVTLLAQVEDDVAVNGVTAHWDRGTGEQTAPMFDDGAHQDGPAGDGLYGAAIGTFATGSIVRYWFTARDGAGQEGRYPFAGNPTPTLGFYIQPSGINPSFEIRSNSGLVSSKPPVYHLLLDTGLLTGNPPHLANPTTYVRGTFIFNGEVFDNIRVRHRGQSSLGVSKKHWKVDFNKDHRFRTPFENHPEVDNINIQSSYGDKTFLREWLSYKAWMDVGQPGLEMWPIRLYLNGTYRGLYVHLENPNADWLDRTGLDSEGWLWKSYSEAKGGTGGFELKANGGNAANASTALGTFISNMNTQTGANLTNYINSNVNVQAFTDFLALIQLIHNCDHPAKNYLVYADEDTPAGTWAYYLWDADLTHGRNFECAGGGVYNDTIRWDMFGDTQLLFGTSVKPKCDGPWNGVINGFLQRTMEFRAPFYARTSELLEQLYSPDVLDPIIDDMAANLQSPVNEVHMDWDRNTPYGSRSTYTFHVNELKKFVQNRYDYLRARLDTLTGNVEDLDGLTCTRSGSNAVLSWTRHGVYESIRVYRNDSLVRTLGGSANGLTTALDLAASVNVFRVANVVAGSEHAGESCTIVTASGEYAKVIDEDFSPAVGAAVLAVSCAATQANGVLQLTAPVGDQAGTAFFRQEYPDGDFIADFDFRMDEPSDPGADGLAFVFSAVGDPTHCGSPGGALGYFTDDTDSATTLPGVAIVFDTWQNPGEPSHNWVGLYDARSGTSARLEAVAVPEEFTGNGTFHATVLGKDGTIELLLSNAGIGMAPRQIFEHTLASYVERDSLFGFTAGTGGSFARHIIDNFVLQVNTGTPAPTAGFTAIVRTGSAPFTVTFSNTSTGATSYAWTFGDGGTSTDVSPSHVYQGAGVYTVSLTATGTGGADTHTEPGYITVTSSVKAAFSGVPIAGAAPLPVQFSNQSTGASSYMWDFGDGQTSNLEAPAHTYAAGGEYTVTLTAHGDGGSQDIATRTRYVQVDGAITADFAAAPRQGTAPLVVQFSDATIASAPIQSYVWDFGDGETSVEANPQHTYAANGQYTVTLQAFGFATSDTATKAAFIRVGVGGPTFIRGDANADRKVDISDAIYILSYLFSGGVTPDCLDALDSDDTGRIDLTDAVRILGFLFQGQQAPASPYPTAGSDASGDDLEECSRV